MKLSDELVQGFALGEPMLKAMSEQVADACMSAEDDEWMGMTIPGLEKLYQDFVDRVEASAREHLLTGDGAPKPNAIERCVKARFRELLAQHPELTRPQAYAQAVMEAGEPVIMKATIGNLDEYRYCTMTVESDDNDEEANLD